jgi:hypothetical protein
MPRKHFPSPRVLFARIGRRLREAVGVEVPRRSAARPAWRRIAGGSSVAEREIFGEWSTPEGQSAEGRLLVDRDGYITLQLRRRLPERPLLQGQLGDGTPATLLGADLLRLDPGADHYVCELAIGTAVIGLRLPGLDSPTLISGEARIAGLAQALDSSGLSLETSDITRRKDAFARVEWKESKPLEVGLPGGTLVLAEHPRFEHSSYFRFVLEHRVVARYRAEEPVSLEALEQIFDVLCGFVSFAVEARVSLDSVTLTAAPREPGEAGASSGRGSAERLAHHRPHHGRSLEEIEPWLTLAALSDPGGALAGFYRFWAEQPSAYLILFEYLIFAEQLNPIDKLLYLARFLEVYHRTADPRERDPPEVQAERVTAVKRALGGQHKVWANQILRHSNEVTFKERVGELLDGPAAVAKPILGAEPEVFARLLGNCRNYWTHYSPEEERKALRDDLLDEFDDRVLLVVRACVLNHIGVPAADAQAALETDWRWEARSGSALEQP